MKNYDMMYKHWKCSYRHHHPTHRPHRGVGTAENSPAMGRNSANIGGWRPPPPDRRVRRRPPPAAKPEKTRSSHPRPWAGEHRFGDGYDREGSGPWLYLGGVLPPRAWCRGCCFKGLAFLTMFYIFFQVLRLIGRKSIEKSSKTI